MQNLPYRPNVCLLILNKADLLFLGERYRQPGVWQFPQGGAEPEYSLAENALREAKEELGIPPELIKIERQLLTTHQYDFTEAPPYAKGKWRGQSQTFWLLRFLGSDQDINLAKYDQELASFKWCTITEVLQLAEPKRLAGYKKVLAELAASA